MDVDLDGSKEVIILDSRGFIWVVDENDMVVVQIVLKSCETLDWCEKEVK